MAQNGGPVAPWIPGVESLFSWLVPFRCVSKSLNLYINAFVMLLVVSEREFFAVMYREKQILMPRDISSSL